MPNNSQKWLLLIHQIPPKPNALRVKIWRRLQQRGAVAIKQSVYAMPPSEESREDLSWILKEITDGGGDGSILEVQFVEGLNDEQITALFLNARQSDYDKIIHEANLLLKDWSSGQFDPKNPALKGQARISKLQKRLDEIMEIDFFKASQQKTAQAMISNLAACLSGPTPTISSVSKKIDNLKGKTWVTRKNLFVDRLACAWLIKRFIDSAALFKFVDQENYTPMYGEIRFDMFEGEFTHRGDFCTFEVMVQELNLQDQALTLLAQVVHDIDLKDIKYNHAETNGFNALLQGLTATQLSDAHSMTGGVQLFENLYAYFGVKK